MDDFAETVDALGLEFLAPLGGDSSNQLEDVVQLRARWFLIDEPESHLHPAAQRETARWLVEQAQLLPELFVLASHASAFLALRSGTRLTHVRRAATRRVSLTSLDPLDLKAVDESMNQLGFDRGELLALHRAVLFVEGANDQVVLESLYRDRIRELGLLIQPFHGTGNYRNLLEAHTLFRVLAPPFHVLVDNVPPSTVETLRNYYEGALAEYLEEAKTAKPEGEALFLANVRLAGLREGHQLEIHSIETKDIIGELDDSTVAELLGHRNPRNPPYPGFGAVLDEAHNSGKRYTEVLAQRYGFSKKDLGLFAEIANVMHERGNGSAALSAVLDAIEASLPG
ncbi:MAG: hypothetical protein H0U16_04475 [Actinobacteria bacterium]|nr:hypothetical protein [Actinomycetota bacterium]